MHQLNIATSQRQAIISVAFWWTKWCSGDASQTNHMRKPGLLDNRIMHKVVFQALEEMDQLPYSIISCALQRRTCPLQLRLLRCSVYLWVFRIVGLEQRDSPQLHSFVIGVKIDDGCVPAAAVPRVVLDRAVRQRFGSCQAVL